MNISAGPGIAIREFPLTVGEADYLLYLDGKAAGTIEAKPEGHTLSGVERQSAKYISALPVGVPSHRLPLPFCYESTGKETQFTNLLDPSARSRLVFTFHRPEELRRLVTMEKQLRARLRELPPLNAEGLWEIKKKAIGNLEASLGDNKPRSLIQMATGGFDSAASTSEPRGAMAGFDSAATTSEPRGAMAGFELLAGSAEPMGALAGFGSGAPSRRCRATVSRSMPSSWAIRRCDQPRWCKVKMLSMSAILSWFAMLNLSSR